MKRIIMPQFVVTTVLWMIPLFFVSCGSLNQRGRTVPGTKGTVLADVQGLSPEDSQREDLLYWLICEGMEPLVGERTPRNGPLVLFKSGQLKDGLKCSIEVKGEPQDGLVWLSEPSTPGLYYASSASQVENSRLNVTLYKIYRKADQESDTDLAVNVTDGGICSQFDLKTRQCVSEEPASGFGLGLQAASARLSVVHIQAGSAAEKAGFAEGDVIIAAEDVQPQTEKELNDAIEAGLSSRGKAWVSVLRAGATKMLWIRKEGDDA